MLGINYLPATQTGQKLYFIENNRLKRKTDQNQFKRTSVCMQATVQKHTITLKKKKKVAIEKVKKKVNRQIDH